MPTAAAGKQEMDIVVRELEIACRIIVLGAPSVFVLSVNFWKLEDKAFLSARALCLFQAFFCGETRSVFFSVINFGNCCQKFGNLLTKPLVLERTRCLMLASNLEAEGRAFFVVERDPCLFVLGVNL